MTGIQFFIFGLIKTALAGAATGTAIVLVTIAYLNWDRIVRWMQSRAGFINQDPDRVGFSLVDRLQNGNYRTVYGIINRSTGQLLDGEAVTSREIDAQTAAEHRNDEILIY
jgi:hypothetical protein